MISRIIFIRHGITEGNLKHWFYGAVDLPLTEQGKTELKKYVKTGIYPQLPEDADYYTTGLCRTEETFQILFGERPHKALPKLKEMNFGAYECKTYQDMEQDRDFQAWAWDKSGDAKLGGGESANEFRGRVLEGLKDLVNLHRLKEWSHRHSGKDAVSAVVCHGGVISCIMDALFPDACGTMWDWMPEPGFGYIVDFRDSDPYKFTRISDINRVGFALYGEPAAIGKLALAEGYGWFDLPLDPERETGALFEAERDRMKTAVGMSAETLIKKGTGALLSAEESPDREKIDYFYIDGVSDRNLAALEAAGIWDFLKDSKRKGAAVKAGIALSEEPLALEEVIKNHAELDFIKMPVNYLNWFAESERGRRNFDTARRYFKQVIIDSPLAGGLLADPPEEAKAILREAAPDRSFTEWALRFVLALPFTIITTVGTSDPAHLREDIGIAERWEALSEEEEKTLAEAACAISLK